MITRFHTGTTEAALRRLGALLALLALPDELPMRRGHRVTQPSDQATRDAALAWVTAVYLAQRRGLEARITGPATESRRPAWPVAVRRSA